MLGGPGSGPGAGAALHRTWQPAPVLPNSRHLCSTTGFTPDVLNRCGLYSVFPAGTFCPPHSEQLSTPPQGFHSITSSIQNKLSETTPTGCYTFGALTPPPGSPLQLELLAKSFSNGGVLGHHISGIPSLPTPPCRKDDAILLKQRWTACENSPHSFESLSPISSSSSSKRQYPCKAASSSPSKLVPKPSPGKSPKTSPCSRFEDGGCSRTNPIYWTPHVVKREPGSTPVTEIAEHQVKVEIGSPRLQEESVHTSMMQSTTTMASITTCSTGNGTIPVGIAVARQRLQQQETSGGGGLLAACTATHQQTAVLKEISAPAMTLGVTGAGGPLLHCSEDRTNSIATWSLPPPHGHALATPTLWQYPAPVSMEPMLPLPVPMPPVGFQLIRDPSSGHFLLIPTTSFEQLQQAVVWPTTTYQQQPPSHHVLLPPPPPLAPLQLLGSSDYLTTASTTLHQHTQTHSTRLVALTAGDVAKRKLSLPAHTLIKIEADSQDHKTLQTVATASNNAPTMFTDPNLTPLLTTHVFYQHPGNMIQISPPTTSVPTVTASLEQQTTSHITCLTPPPENLAIEDVPCVHDAGNQTDMVDDTETASETQEMVSDEQISDTKCDDGHVSDTTSEHTNIFINGSQDPTEINSIVQKTNNNNSSTIILNDLSYETPKTTEIENKIQENISEKILPEQPENIINNNNNNNNVDLSGLELLSNSIVEFENCRQTSTIKFEKPAIIKTEKVESKESNLHETGEEVLEKIAVMSLKDKTVQEDQHDSLGGLGLLCALAEQRILEEVGRNEKKTIPKIIKKEFVSSEEPNTKQKRVFSNEETEHEQRKKLKVEQKAETGDIKISKLRESKLDFKRDECGLVASDDSLKKDCDKNINDTNDEFPINTDDWSKMNALEIDMRMRLAELQRRCEEKRLELSKLTPKTCSKKLFKKSKIDRSPSPPKLDKEDAAPVPNTHVYSSDILKPPTLSVSIEHKSIEDEDDIPFKYVKPDSFKRKHEPEEASIVSPLLEKISSSKKRKVGRPKKFSSPDLQDATETIVAKKPKSLVGYLLAAKNRLQTQSKQYSSSLSPPRYTEDSQSPKPMLKVHSKCRKKKLRSIKHINKQKHKRNSTNKIRPKLKAEPLVKSFSEDENDDNWSEKSFDTVSTVEKKKSSKKKSHDDDIKEYDNKIAVTESVVEEVKVSPCVLTIEHLETDKLRVLTSMGGLFYAGVLSAIQPPDIYAVTLDGERGNRPHIMSQEEILRDAIVEVSPQSSDDLTPGVRLCAYWSQQYRCLYPGTVAEPETSDNLNSRFVNVEFDDGDSGCIAMEDIRLLPSDYPIIEYDPNPLLSLSKRRRRISSTGDEQKRIIPESTNKFQETKVKSVEKEVLSQKSKKSQKAYKVHKKMKKHRKEKIEKLRKDIKKRKKKHKCSDEHCKHRKHRKHKKHKKHHHKDIETENDEIIKENPEEVQEEKEENCAENNIEIEENSTESEDAKSTQKIKKIRERQESVESKSKMAAFLPARQLWSWSGKGYKRPGAKGKAKKQFFKTIQRGKELITVGDAAVFLSTGRPDRPYIGRIESMWESWGNSMIVKVKWFYHPEETVGCPESLKYPGALFESPHIDENDVQTISHKCEVLPLKEYTNKLGADPQKYEAIYDNNDIYYRAGYYDPTVMTLKMEPDIPTLT